MQYADSDLVGEGCFVRASIHSEEASRMESAIYFSSKWHLKSSLLNWVSTCKETENLFTLPHNPSYTFPSWFLEQYTKKPEKFSIEGVLGLYFTEELVPIIKEFNQRDLNAIRISRFSPGSKIEMSLLFLAVKYNLPDLIIFLSACGYDFSKDFGMEKSDHKRNVYEKISSLYVACERNAGTLVKLLLNEGIDSVSDQGYKKMYKDHIEEMTPVKHQTSLNIACANNANFFRHGERF